MKSSGNFIKAHQRFYFDTDVIVGERSSLKGAIFCKWPWIDTSERTVQEYAWERGCVCDASVCLCTCVYVHTWTNKEQWVGSKQWHRLRNSYCLHNSGGTIQIQRPHSHGLWQKCSGQLSLVALIQQRRPASLLMSGIRLYVVVKRWALEGDSLSFSPSC